MDRRSKAGRETTNRRPRKISKPERGNAPKGQARIKSTPAIEQTEIERLTRERDEALEREKARAEVLRVVSSSPGQLEPR